MDAFARECFKLGTLRGFKHFKAELRGREEMMLEGLSIGSTAGAEVPSSNGAATHNCFLATACHRL